MDFIYKPDAIDGHDWVRILLAKSGTQRWDPHIDWYWEVPSLTSEEAGRVLRAWQQFQIEMLAWMRSFDVLLCPVYARSNLPSAFEHDGDTLNGFTYTAAFNYTGWPAAVVRCGTSGDGMPIGVQVVSHAWREDICWPSPNTSKLRWAAGNNLWLEYVISKTTTRFCKCQMATGPRLIRLR